MIQLGPLFSFRPEKELTLARQFVARLLLDGSLCSLRSLLPMEPSRLGSIPELRAAEAQVKLQLQLQLAACGQLGRHFGGHWRRVSGRKLGAWWKRELACSEWRSQDSLWHSQDSLWRSSAVQR